MPPSSTSSSDTVRPPSFREATRVWLRIGLLGFGGPTGQIALMHQELVEQRRWISEARFLHALNFCMLLPGPEAQQLSVYIGWLLHKGRGAVVAGTLFVLPGALLLGLISSVYVVAGNLSGVEAVFYGLKPAVLALVAAAGLRIGRRALRHPALWGIAISAFLALFLFRVPFPALIAAVAGLGWWGGRFFPTWFRVSPTHGGTTPDRVSVIDNDGVIRPEQVPPGRGALRTAVLWLGLWSLPFAVVGGSLGRDHVLFQLALFFSKAAVVTFGGAYAVLPYVAQQAVETQGWLTATQMLDGLALAETTPGPLILVLQHVGFLAAWTHPAPFSPATAALLGAMVTTWCTFVPSFLFVLLGAPFIETLRGEPQLSAALSAITAAVVGVIFNLAVWFAIHVLVPRPHQVDFFTATIAALAFFVLTRWRGSTIPVILACALLGLGYRWIT
ncbi:MAG: chromate efflux transporter [Opitutaceae bacterium]|nr:chromate efflux transporter [Opitutaceae bacterium]